MNNDIRPPQRPVIPASPEDVSQPTEASDASASLPVVSAEPATEAAPEPQPRKRRALLWSLLGGGILVALLIATGVIWYYQALRPVDTRATERMRVSVTEQSRARDIGQLLYDKQLIRSTLAFDIYTRLSGTRNELKAGSYNLSQSESMPEIIKHLVAGRADTVTITFYPGATLRDERDIAESKKTDVTTVLLRAGYTKAEIDAALGKQYAHPLLEGKPAEADLEGYVYGETYNFSSDATVEEILTHTFDIFYQKIQERNLSELFKQRELTLYQGITLASIVQREVGASNANEASPDQRQVAQVFYSRLAMDMPLGSDVTAYYGADQLGVARTVEVDSPYNTRKYTGLTPGPIASPSIGALAATASPADGDYLYFLSGDDEVTYFARTDEEHQANIKNHCHVKCAIP